MEMNLNSIGLCEDAAFKAWSRRMEKLRQPLDLLDFSVEHLSKWWAMLDIHKNPIAYQSITSKLEAYIEKGLVEFPTVDDPVLKHTIAMIAFMPIRKGNDERSRRITMLSLGSTLESLRRAEMGRVVVVMLDEEDESYALETFQYLAEKLSSDSIPIERHNNNNNNVNAVTKIGHMEVAFVKIPKESTKTHIVKVNMPYGCLAGIRKAIFLAEGSSSLKNDNTTTSDHTDDAANPVYVQRWFGSNHDPSYYQYLYLTEPDSILQSRPSTLKQIKQEVDQGGIVAPHRLQPIPHESDLRGLEDKSLYLNEKDGFEEVLVLDAVNNHDVCCDDTGANKPGMNSFPKCPKNFRWWSCGLRYKDPNDPDPQKRLRPYKLIRLAQGVGLTTIAGTLHARRCIPGTTSYCRTLSTTSKSGKY